MRFQAALALVLSSSGGSIPQSLDCPAPLVWREQYAFLDLHPDGGSGNNQGQQCRRSDGVPQGPTVTWWPFPRRTPSMIGFYCGGHAQGRWSYFRRNGALAREGSFTGPSRKHGAWADYDTSGRKVLEVVHADGREISRQEYPRSRVELAVDPAMVDRVAVERYEAALRQTCTAAPVPLRPFLGLRAELLAADAVLLLRPVDLEMLDRPPGWVDDMPPLPQRIRATVKKVLAGSHMRPGETIDFVLQTADHHQRVEKLMGTPEFQLGVDPTRDVTALVRRTGERWELLNLLAANEGERTDALFKEYARLAALDDRGFTLGLARHIADRVRSAPDRLLWVNWMRLALDDWDRLPAPSPSTRRELDKILTGALPTVLGQIDAVVRGRHDGWLNLYELPWLVRLLDERERRLLAAALLRLHPIVTRELEQAEGARDKNPAPRGPLDELTHDDIRRMAASSFERQLMECLAACVDPRDASHRSPADTVARAKEFVRSGPSRARRP